MTPPSSDPAGPAPDPAAPSAEAEVEVSVADFLPDGVSVGEPAAGEPASSVAAPDAPAPVDLDALDQLERDLDAVDAAIARLDDGTYGLDPTTGEAIADDLRAADPTRTT